MMPAIIGIIFGWFLVNSPEGCITPLGVVILGLGLGVFLIARHAFPESREFIFVFMLALFSRVTLTTVLYLSSFFVRNAYKPGFLFLNDGYPFSENGWLILRIYLANVPIKTDFFVSRLSLSGTVSAYDYWNAIVYYFTGKSPLSIFFFNSAVGALVAVFTFLVAIKIFGRHVAILASFLVAIWPSLNMWSSQNFKDPLIDLGVITIIFFILEVFQKKFSTYLFSIAMLSAFILYKFRYHTALILLASLVIYAFFYAAVKAKLLIKLHPLAGKIMLVILLLFIVCGFMLLLFKWVLIYDHIANEWNKSFELWRYILELKSDGNMKLPVAQLSNGWGMALAPLTYLVYGFLTPFPWQFPLNLFGIILLIEIALYYFLFYYFVKGIILAVRNPGLKMIGFIIIFVFLYLIILGASEGNSGILLRHRSAVLPFYFMFASYALLIGQKRKETYAGKKY
jgi:hypothetical protein